MLFIATHFVVHDPCKLTFKVNGEQFTALESIEVQDMGDGAGRWHIAFGMPAVPDELKRLRALSQRETHELVVEDSSGTADKVVGHKSSMSSKPSFRRTGDDTFFECDFVSLKTEWGL